MYIYIYIYIYIYLYDVIVRKEGMHGNILVYMYLCIICIYDMFCMHIYVDEYMHTCACMCAYNIELWKSIQFAYLSSGNNKITLFQSRDTLLHEQGQ